MKSLKLSVIMPNYNHAKYISEALDAIVNQSFEPFEVIVCDDGSTDNSIEIIEQFVNKYHFVRLIKNGTNLGVFPTHNRLMTEVSGDYLYSAAADDKVLPGFFEKSMKLLEKYPQAGICSTISSIINEEGKRTGFILNPIVSKEARFFPPEEVRYIFERQGSWLYGVTSIMRLDYFRYNGGYRPELFAYTDGFIEELLALKYGACFVPEPLTCWRRLSGGYALAVSNDPGIYVELIKNATSLMETKFSDIFPEKYIEAWRRQNTFYYRYNNYRKILQEKEIFAIKRENNIIGNFWVLCLKLFSFLKKAVFLCYLSFIFKKSPWRALYNRIVYFILGCRYGFKETV